MDMTYYHSANGLYYEVPTGVTYLTNGTGDFMGYQNATGEIVSVNNLTGLTQNQYNNIGVQEGQKAAQTSINMTYYHSRNGMYYHVPVGVEYLTNATGNFIGYRENNGTVVSVNDMDSLDQTQFNTIGFTGSVVGNEASNIGVVEGQQAAQTSQSYTYYHAEDGLYYKVPEGADFLVNGSGHFQGYTTSSGSFTSVGSLTGMTQNEYNNIGVTQGQQARTTSVQSSTTTGTVTHVEQNGVMYNIPAGATPEFNSQGNLTGYETTSKVTGAVTEYDYNNGQRQVSGYHVPMSELSPVSSSTHYIGANVIHAGSSANLFGTSGYEIPG